MISNYMKLGEINSDNTLNNLYFIQGEQKDDKNSNLSPVYRGLTGTSRNIMDRSNDKR